MFDIPKPTIPVSNGDTFPVRRIFCVGKNYPDHVREMGGNPDSEPPVYFTKPADALFVPSDRRERVPFPPHTDNLHFEGEFVVALGRGGAAIGEQEATDHIFGYALGCDLTRRDLQAAAKKRGGPWDMAKAFDHSAIVGPILVGADINPATDFVLRVNEVDRQHAHVDEMVWSIPKIIADLSTYVTLAPGDLIFTGTPAGVGPLARGDHVEISSGVLPSIQFWMGE